MQPVKGSAAAIDRLTDLVMTDRPAIAGEDLDALLIAATSAMTNRKRADHLVSEFRAMLGFIEVSFLIEKDGGVYLEEDRKACIALLQEMAGTSQ